MRDELRNIRDDYDRLAEQYTNHIADELRHKPLDRELLNRFITQVQGYGRVCDMGCGPGHVARYLHNGGLDIFGLDLSAGMIEQARKLSPAIRFQQGDMLNLDLPDNSLAGIVAFYAIVNLDRSFHPRVFQEMFRVLQPGGTLLLSFHIGTETVQPPELWDVKISMSFYFFEPAEIRADLGQAGFGVQEIIEREPYSEVEYPSRRAYTFATKPEPFAQS